MSAEITATEAIAARPVRVRVAPSPTGDPHVGTAYMALFNVAFARQQGGEFILRIEDTDRARYQEDSEQQLYDMLSWLGLDWQEGPDRGGPYAPYRQSERLSRYRPYIDKLLADGHAYYCWCTADRLQEMREAQQAAKRATGYDRLCYGKSAAERAELPGFSEVPVVRMLIPDDPPLRFADVIRGDINAPRPDDQVILKADGFPTYHLAVVVDDHEMGITHVVRGEEWISSTPKHLLLYRWLGLPEPKLAHMPLLRNVNKSKISKRKNPAARLTWFKEQGYLPEALRNFLAILGYSMPGGTEIFTLDEMIEHFDWARVNTVGPVFDIDKLDWMNGHYLRALPQADLAQRLLARLIDDGLISAEPTAQDRERITAVTPLVQTRMVLLSEAAAMIGFLLIDDDHLEIAPEARAALPPQAGEILQTAISALAGLSIWESETLETSLRTALISGLELKPKLAFGPLRIAITGSKISPPLFESMEILGADSCLARLRALVTQLP